MSSYNLCIVKPNRSAFSETFIQAHINRLLGNKKVLYGGSFPLYDENGKLLIRSILGVLSYLIQKRLLKRRVIPVRTQALISYLKAQHINLVFAEYGTVGAMITDACKLANVPLIIHFHGADAHHQPTIDAHQYGQAFAYASAIIAVSEDMVKQLSKLGASKEKLFLNPCGVDTAFFNLIDVQNNPPNFLSIGRFVEKKSPTSLVKAFYYVATKIPDAHLWMVGTGALIKETKALAIKLKLTERITFTGVLLPADILLLMKKMRCFVQHSVRATDGDMEGSPVAILEASASGLPVVSTKHAGIKQAVLDKKTGFLVCEHDIVGMAEYMIAIASSTKLATQMGLNGRQHMIDNYQMEKQINKLDTIIQQCIVIKQTP